MLTYSHQVPTPKVPIPKAKPLSAAERAGIPSHSHISTAGQSTASGQSLSGANAHASSAPASNASVLTASAGNASGCVAVVGDADEPAGTVSAAVALIRSTPRARIWEES